MKENNKKAVQDLISSYSKGNRYFKELELNDGDLRNSNFENSLFEKCWLAVDFSNANLKNSKFINCNLKTTNFSHSDLTNAIIENSSVESTKFKGAITKDFDFSENTSYGKKVGMKEFEETFLNE